MIRFLRLWHRGDLTNLAQLYIGAGMIAAILWGLR